VYFILGLLEPPIDVAFPHVTLNFEDLDRQYVQMKPAVRYL